MSFNIGIDLWKHHPVNGLTYLPLPQTFPYAFCLLHFVVRTTNKLLSAQHRIVNYRNHLERTHLL